MALVSLTLGKVTYDTRQDRYLQIKLAEIPVERTMIRAVGIPERLYYRLDVVLESGQSVFKLPLLDVVAPKRILPDAFGAYAIRAMKNGQNAFLPVYATIRSASEEAEVLAVFRPGSDVSDVQWRQYAPGAPPTTWLPVVGASDLVPRGTPLTIGLGKNVLTETVVEVSFLLDGVGRADRFLLLPR